MLSIAERDGYANCYYDTPALDSIVARTGLTAEQACAWAHNARMRHGGGDDMQLFLRMSPLGDDEVCSV